MAKAAAVVARVAVVVARAVEVGAVTMAAGVAPLLAAAPHTHQTQKNITRSRGPQLLQLLLMLGCLV